VIKKYIVLALIFFTVFVAPAFAAIEKGGLVDDDVLAASDKDIAMPKAMRKPMSFSYGGWITPVMFDQTSGQTGSSKELMSTDISTKLWLQFFLTENMHVYVRGRDSYQYTMKHDGYPFTDTLKQSKNLIDLDAGYVDYKTENRMIQVTLGRKFFLIGTGLIINGRADGGEIAVYTPLVDVRAFGAYTGYLKKDANPYGLSTKEKSNAARRIFAGGTIEKTIENQTIYLLGVGQIDNGKEDAVTKSRYQSQYYGAGAKGTIESGQYFGEFIYETGDSYTDTTVQEKSKIKAMAAMMGANYYFSMPLKPVLSFLYAYGSGDKDKYNYSGSSTGNTGGDDKGFGYFGTFLAGYGLRPYLANIHVIQFGFTVTPFESMGIFLLKRINVSAKYSYFMKDVAEAGINAGEALNNSDDIGQEFNASLRWGIFYDLSFFTYYAVFVPGNAFDSSEKNRHFVMCGFNIVF
jgi:hypothetical protein